MLTPAGLQRKKKLGILESGKETVLRAFVLIVLAALGGGAAAQEVSLRHGLEGRALDALATLVVRFNDAQRGRARIVLEDVHGLEDKRRLPDMALLDSDDATSFFGTRPRFRPLHQVMAEAGESFRVQFYPQVADAVEDLTGKTQALPLGLALPVLYYRRDAFRKAGLDPDRPPQTWWEVQNAAAALFDAGFACPLTSSRFSWVHVENISSQAGEPILVKSGQAQKLTVNRMVNVKHIALLASWQKSRYFHYFGPAAEGDRKFALGECAMLTGDSRSYAALAREARDIGVAALPHYDDVYGAKAADVLADGAALWVLPGKKKENYKVVARFVGFLLRPDSQKEWVRATGSLPMTAAAFDALRASGAPAAVVDQAAKRLKTPKQGFRTANGTDRSRFRSIVDEEIAFVWENAKPAKEALDTAVSRANSLISSAHAAPARP